MIAPRASVESWWLQANCRSTSVDMVDARKQDEIKLAKAVCEGCPVMADCLALAMAEERGLPLKARFGVRGGKSHKERWLLAKEDPRCLDCDVAVPSIAFRYCELCARRRKNESHAVYSQRNPEKRAAIEAGRGPREHRRRAS